MMPARRGEGIVTHCEGNGVIVVSGSPLGEGIVGGGDGRTETRRVAEWYAGLEATCLLLPGGLCSWYEQRPIACRAEQTDSSHVAPMPMSIVQALGQLTAELEGSQVEPVTLPFAFAWAQENLERSERTWPAVFMVERFIEILKSMASSDSRLCGVAAAS